MTQNANISIFTFEPIKVQTRSAPQNDHLNLSLVKDIYVDDEKLARNGHHWLVPQILAYSHYFVMTDLVIMKQAKY